MCYFLLPITTSKIQLNHRTTIIQNLVEQMFYNEGYKEEATSTLVESTEMNRLVPHLRVLDKNSGGAFLQLRSPP